MTIQSILDLDLSRNNNYIFTDDQDLEDFGYSLYPEQKKVLSFMKNIEITKNIEDEKGNIINYNKVCLAAPFSFGKTIVSLALIKSKNIPIERSWFSFFNNELMKVDNYKLEVSEMYIKRNKYINTTLVIISPSIFYQWMDSIKLSKLNVLVIDTYKDLDILCVNLINNTLDTFDLVLMVYRKLKNNNPLPLGNINLKWYDNTNLSLISILSIDKCWKRIIIDDFDSINIYQDLLIPARIIWFISATVTCKWVPKILYYTNKCYEISAINHRVMDIVRDSYFSKMSIRSGLNIKLPLIRLKCYMFPYAETVNTLINELNYPSSVSEKINSGDISGAAELIGIAKKCSTLGEFLYLLIIKNKNSYEHCLDEYNIVKRIIVFIKDNVVLLNKVRTNEDLVMGKYITPVKFIQLRKKESILKYKNKLSLGLEYITFDEFTSIEMYIKLIKESISVLENSLDKIKRNLEEFTCGKCLMELDDCTVYITECCSIPICDSCLLKQDTEEFMTICPSCTQGINKHSLISLPKNIKLDTFININFEEALEKLQDYNKNKVVDKYEDLTPKDQTLLKILSNDVNDEYLYKTRDGLNIKNLIEGSCYIENKDLKYKKYVIYTRWGDTSLRLSKLLTKHNIQNIILKGNSTRKIYNDIHMFKTGSINVLLIPSQDISAGINLEFATHLIFYHSLRNYNITSQIVGRCQRINRTCSLELIYLNNSREFIPF